MAAGRKSHGNVRLEQDIPQVDYEQQLKSNGEPSHVGTRDGSFGTIL